MKKISNIIICAFAVLAFAACGTVQPTADVNGQTPKDVVNNMYTALQQNDYATAVALCSVPETLTIKHQGGEKEEVSNNIENVLGHMEKEASYKTIKSWEITKVEGSQTDANMATVNAKVTFVDKDNTESVVSTSFSLKRANGGPWKING